MIDESLQSSLGQVWTTHSRSFI